MSLELQFQREEKMCAEGRGLSLMGVPKPMILRGRKIACELRLVSVTKATI